MARPLKSEQLHWLQGTHSQATEPGESEVQAGRPTTPKHISRTAQVKFRRLCDLLAARRTLTQGDGELLTLYCVQFDTHLRARKALNKEGEVVSATRISKAGEPYEVQAVNPWMPVAEKAEAKMISILDRLGLTPHNRDKVKAAAPKDNGEDPIIV
jgi:P27 family predicted phage terminase small subunit